MRSGYGSSSEVKLCIFVFNRVRGVTLMKGSITVTEYKLCPVCKVANLRIGREISLGDFRSKLFRPVFGAAQKGF